MSQSDDADVDVVVSNEGLDTVRRLALIAGVGAWMLALSLVVSAIVVGGGAEAEPPPPTTTPFDLDVGDEDVPATTEPSDSVTTITEPDLVVPADFREAQIGINACDVADCASTLSSTITPPAVTLDAPLGEITFTIGLENTARADADGNGTGYFISEITLADDFVPVENKSDCPTIIDRVPLRASETTSCTMVARGTNPDYHYSNDPLEVGISATVYMLDSTWESGEQPQTYPVTLRSVSVDVPK